MNSDSKYNPNTSQGVYSHKMHHRELVLNSSVINDAPPAFNQKLDADKGLNGAKEILADRWKDKNIH